jgi:hypothetical protein
MTILSSDHHARFEGQQLHSEQSDTHQRPDDHVALVQAMPPGVFATKVRARAFWPAAVPGGMAT